MDESPEYANPFLSPEFAIGVGRHRGGARVAVLREGGEPVGFLPFERNALGVGRAIGLGLSDCQALVHRPGSPGTPTNSCAPVGCPSSSSTISSRSRNRSAGMSRGRSRHR